MVEFTTADVGTMTGQDCPICGTPLLLKGSMSCDPENGPSPDDFDIYEPAVCDACVSKVAEKIREIEDYEDSELDDEDIIFNFCWVIENYEEQDPADALRNLMGKA